MTDAVQRLTAAPVKVLLPELASAIGPVSPRGMRALAVALCGVLLCSRGLFAQCPDGTPPPCARAAARAPARNSIAVLYFDNLSRDTAYAYVADGLTEDLITLLGAVPRLEVRSRNASARVRGQHQRGPVYLARTLGVAYLVSGSVQPGAGRMRVNAELTDAAGRRVWGRLLTASGADPLAVQESIATAVVGGIAGQLLPEERTTLARRATRDSVAWDLFQRGRFFASRFTEADLHTAITLYQQAIAHDSSFADAWAAVAFAWIFLADDWVAPLDAYPRAREAAQRALALDSNMAAGYVALTWPANVLDLNSALAERLARRAVTLDPRLPDAHMALSQVLPSLGRWEEARVEGRRAWELDSLSTLGGTWYSRVLVSMGRDDASTEALAFVRRMRERDPAAAATWSELEAEALLALGRCREADDVVRALRERDRYAFRLAGIAAACLGRPAAARSALDSLAAEAHRRYVWPTAFAEIHGALGNADSTLAWLETAYRARDASLTDMSAAQWWHPAVRQDPRVQAFFRRIGMPGLIR